MLFFFLGVMVETTLNMLITESILNEDQSVLVKRPWTFNPSSARGVYSLSSPTVWPRCRELGVRAWAELMPWKETEEADRPCGSGSTGFWASISVV